MKISHIFYFIVLGLGLNACAAKEKTTVAEVDLGTEAIAQWQDFSGLSGCKNMFVTTDGIKLLPQSLQHVDDLAIGQYARLYYTSLVDNASICMAEDTIIRINALEKLPLEEFLPDCEVINAPAEQQWLAQFIRRNNIVEVQRYVLGAHYLYWSINDRGYTVIHDCVGNTLCAFEKGVTKDCALLSEDMTFQFTIYDKNFRK